MLRSLFYNEKIILSTIKNDELKELTHSESLFVKKQLRKIGALSFGRVRDNSVIQFRGTSNKYDLLNFGKALFVVGEKANYYGYTSETRGNFASHQNIRYQIDDMIKLINKKGNKILTQKLTYDDFKDFEEKEIFQLCKYILHNLGGNTYHKVSEFVSLSSDFKVAKKFATGRNKRNEKPYVIVCINNTRREQLRAQNLKEIFNKIGFKWYKDINYETMLQDAISPDDIIGILDVRENIFLINNFLVEAKKIPNFNLSSMNIPIDQRDFFALNKSLGNESYAIVNDDRLEGRYDSPL